jgi:hypothetical protein
MRCAKYDQYSKRGTHTTLRCISSPDVDDDDDAEEDGGTHTDTVSSTISTMDGGHGSKCASDLCASSTSSRHSAF